MSNPILMADPQTEPDKVEVVVGGKKYEIDRHLVGNDQGYAFVVDVQLDSGFTATIRITKGLALATDTFKHFTEKVSGNTRNMTIRVIKQWLMAGHKNVHERDLEALFDRYKKRLLDDLLARKILEETK